MSRPTWRSKRLLFTEFGVTARCVHKDQTLSVRKYVSLSTIVLNSYSRDRQGMPYGMQHFCMPRNPPYNRHIYFFTGIIGFVLS